MQSFRKKYLYNPENPIYSSENVKTYNCMNTETKNKKLIILHHLKEPPFVQPGPGILQPIEIPTISEPYSVYPITRCVSQIGKTGQAQAMYIIKSLLQIKLQNPMYSLLSSQGICQTQVEGILPSKSPDLFNLLIELLDIPANLTETQKSVISKEAYEICRGLRSGHSVADSITQYGWKDVKKQKDIISDEKFVIFKGRRKEEGPFGDQYGIAWHNEHGLCRFKYINLTRDGYEEQFYHDFQNLIQYLKEDKNKKVNALKIFHYAKQPKGIKIFSQIPQQGTLTQYVNIKYKSGKPVNEKNFSPVLDNFVDSMRTLSLQLKAGGIGTLHIKNLFMHGNKICVGEPLLITDKIEKKMRQLKNSMDYFSPELKQKIILPEELLKLDREKMDIWLFGFLLHKVFTREVPIFDSGKRPILAKEKVSVGMGELITQCLDLVPEKRPGWKEINMRQLEKKAVLIEEFEDRQPMRYDLGTKSDKKSRVTSSQKKRKEIEELIIEEEYEKKSLEQEKLKPEEDEDEPYASPVPVQISSRLKKVKLILKIVIIMLLYIFVFFRMFLGNSIDILLARSDYTTTSLHLVDYNGDWLSTTTILTNQPLFFLQNDISFAKIQEEYKCIDDHFDPITNPDYSLLTYIQSTGFLALLLCGWLVCILICVTKAISIWKGGISNRPHKNLAKYWIVYAFHELSLAAILFAHFFLFQFFYFSGATPCFSVENYSGIQPFFDSTLYLFLKNENGYFEKVFSTLGIFSIMLFLSTCFYAWGPKLDNKYFISVASIIFRIIPFILFLLICRIGVFLLYSPTAINDQTEIIPSILAGSATGLFGIIPEIFILICIAVEALLELLMYWCESKASESDQLSKLFNIKKKKVTNDESNLNDMSLINNSKQKIDINSMENY